MLDLVGLLAFYFHTIVIFGEIGEHWAQKARETSDNRGKMLRKDGFALAEERYSTCLAASAFKDS